MEVPRLGVKSEEWGKTTDEPPPRWHRYPNLAGHQNQNLVGGRIGDLCLLWAQVTLRRAPNHPCQYLPVKEDKPLVPVHVPPLYTAMVSGIFQAPHWGRSRGRCFPRAIKRWTAGVPAIAQWVKDPALLQLCGTFQLQSDSIPGPGTSIICFVCRKVGLNNSSAGQTSSLLSLSSVSPWVTDLPKVTQLVMSELTSEPRHKPPEPQSSHL